MFIFYIAILPYNCKRLLECELCEFEVDPMLYPICAILFLIPLEGHDLYIHYSIYARRAADMPGIIITLDRKRLARVARWARIRGVSKSQIICELLDSGQIDRPAKIQTADRYCVG